jgi:hypothetical protein
MSPFTPMRLLRIAEPSDHPEFVFEPKVDAFRALALSTGTCRLVSQNGHGFKAWPQPTRGSSCSACPTSHRRPLSEAAVSVRVTVLPVGVLLVNLEAFAPSRPGAADALRSNAGRSVAPVLHDVPVKLF